MKTPFNDGKFINRRKFWVEEPGTLHEGAEGAKHLQQRQFTMTLSMLSVVQQIPKETKHRDIISRSTSNNSSEAQEFNLPNALVTVRVENE